MPSRIPVCIDSQDFPSINRARLHYCEILHRNQPGLTVSDSDQQEIKRLITSAQPILSTHASDSEIRVIQGKYGRHCFAMQDHDRSIHAISIMRSVKQCVVTAERLPPAGGH